MAPQGQDSVAGRISSWQGIVEYIVAPRHPGRPKSPSGTASDLGQRVRFWCKEVRDPQEARSYEIERYPDPG